MKKANKKKQNKLTSKQREKINDLIWRIYQLQENFTLNTYRRNLLDVALLANIADEYQDELILDQF